MSNYILEMKNITKKFANVKALDSVNFKVKKGEIHAICGENGAGKSTLMKILSGTYPYGSYEGEVHYNGELLKCHDIKDSEKKGIVIIHQELALSPLLSIAENIFIGNERQHAGIINWLETKNQAREALKKVGLENENVDTPVNKLGVGKQQLIEISKALAKKVNLLILDEPTAALNDEESKILLDIMLDLKSHGITSIIITHKLNELSYVADSVTIIRDGKTIETLDRSTDDFTEDRIIKGMVGREMTDRYPKREKHISEEPNPLFEIKNWTVYSEENPSQKKLDNINISIKRGEVVGIAGLMGAGRTELAMSIFGKKYGSNFEGELYIDGKLTEINSVKDAIKNKIAYTSEDRKVYGLVLMNDIKENITLASLKQFFSKNNIIDKNKIIIESEKYRNKINIKCSSINQEVSALSGGNQQKVVLAKWMSTEPELLILDEPTRGIDVLAKYEIYNIINELANQGKSIIVISSEMPEVIGICDRCYVLNEGVVVGELDKKDMTQENIMQCIMSNHRKEI